MRTPPKTGGVSMLFETEKANYNSFQLTQDGFNYKGSSYKFNCVAHLFFSWKLTTQRLNFAKVGEAESAYLQIIMSDGKTIKLSFNEAGWIIYGWNSNKKNDIKNLVELHAVLSAKTFSARLVQYQEQITKDGYFSYDGCLFYPSEKIVFRNKEFLVASGTFLKGTNYIEMRPKKYTIVNRILREVYLMKVPRVNTQTDSDVIFYLLKRYFGVQWSDPIIIWPEARA